MTATTHYQHKTTDQSAGAMSLNAHQVAWQTDISADPDEIILQSILAQLDEKVAAKLQEDYGAELADIFAQALAQNGDAVRMLLQSGVPAAVMLDLVMTARPYIADQSTLNALLDHGVPVTTVMAAETPLHMIVASANRDESLFDVLVKIPRLKVADLLLARAETIKLARHLDRFQPDTVRLLLQYGIQPATLEAYIDQCDAVNYQHGCVEHYYRRQVQAILDEARA